MALRVWNPSIQSRVTILASIAPLISALRFHDCPWLVGFIALTIFTTLVVFVRYGCPCREINQSTVLRML